MVFKYPLSPVCSTSRSRNSKTDTAPADGAWSTEECWGKGENNSSRGDCQLKGERRHRDRKSCQPHGHSSFPPTGSYACSAKLFQASRKWSEGLWICLWLCCLCSCREMHTNWAITESWERTCKMPEYRQAYAVEKKTLYLHKRNVNIFICSLFIYLMVLLIS